MPGLHGLHRTGEIHGQVRPSRRTGPVRSDLPDSLEPAGAFGRVGIQSVRTPQASGTLRSRSSYQHMRISVIIPTYNRAHLLRRALSSIAAQTVGVDEIVVVDDGSTDDTRQILEGSNQPVCYVYQPNAGAAAARNRGIEQASCQWIAFLDTDDEWLPRKIESQKRVLRANRSLKWCSCAPEMLFTDGRTIAPSTETIEKAVGETGSMQFFESAMDLQIGTGSYLIH
ncbi:MAG TPA: glycosyltransferase family 2 protein, partial [Phycisphaerae bacterium]|nr:glycosyltransferase family 2 protein [Phycisphaerae bacterium]